MVHGPSSLFRAGKRVSAVLLRDRRRFPWALASDIHVDLEILLPTNCGEIEAISEVLKPMVSVRKMTRPAGLLDSPKY